MRAPNDRASRSHSTSPLPPLCTPATQARHETKCLPIKFAKCEVKMARYWPSSFFIFTDREELKVHKNARKKKTEWDQYPAILTEQVKNGQSITPKNLAFGATNRVLGGEVFFLG